MAAQLLEEQLSTWGCQTEDTDVINYVSGALEALAEDGTGKQRRPSV